LAPTDHAFEVLNLPLNADIQSHAP
jgi:hypothetical protein